MKKIPATSPVLFWPRVRSVESDLYQTARRAIMEDAGMMPEILTGLADISEFFAKNPDSKLYYPVFSGATGWWGELIGAGERPRVTDCIILSVDCKLMVIESAAMLEYDMAAAKIPDKKKGLFAAEIYPSADFFKKISPCASVSDMLATDSGTVLALFSGKNPNRFLSILESSGNSYLGCIGWC